MPPPSHSSSAEDLYHEGLDRLAEGDAAGAAQKLRDCLEVDPGMLDAMHGLIRALQEQASSTPPSRWPSNCSNWTPMKCWPTPASPSCINTRA